MSEIRESCRTVLTHHINPIDPHKRFIRQRVYVQAVGVFGEKFFCQNAAKKFGWSLPPAIGGTYEKFFYQSAVFIQEKCLDGVYVY